VRAELVVLPAQGRATVLAEMATATGIGLLLPAEFDPLRASSFGTGELVARALDLLVGQRRGSSCGGDDSEHESERTCEFPAGGRPRLILAVGGSATVDGGLGMVTALGGRFLDPRGAEVGLGGGAGLERVSAVDLRGLDPRLREVELLLAADVTNPLLGPHGAAKVFGPQKGAGAAEVLRLEDGLSRLRQVVLRGTGQDMAGLPGAGAAGGVGGAAVAMLGSRLCSGIELVLELIRFGERAAGADLVITGEGRLDQQTLSGKAVCGVAAAAARLDLPVLVLAGAVEPGIEERLPGRTVAMCIADGPMTSAECRARAAELVARAADRGLRLFAAGRRTRCAAGAEQGS
jgi:glycerate kinase